MMCFSSLLLDTQQETAGNVEPPSGPIASSTRKRKIVLVNKYGKAVINYTYFIIGMSLNILSCYTLNERGVTTRMESDRNK